MILFFILDVYATVAVPFRVGHGRSLEGTMKSVKLKDCKGSQGARLSLEMLIFLSATLLSNNLPITEENYN